MVRRIGTALDAAQLNARAIAGAVAAQEACQAAQDRGSRACASSSCAILQPGFDGVQAIGYRLSVSLLFEDLNWSAVVRGRGHDDPLKAGRRCAGYSVGAHKTGVPPTDDRRTGEVVGPYSIRFKLTHYPLRHGVNGRGEAVFPALEPGCCHFRTDVRSYARTWVTTV